MQQFANTFIIAGVALLVVGILISGKFGPLGRLPGDVMIEKGNINMYFPFTTMLIVSAVVSLLVWFTRR